MNAFIPDEPRFIIEHDGFDIEEIVFSLPEETRKLIEETVVLSMFEIQLVICDVTETRQSSTFKGMQADKAPHRYIGLICFILTTLCIYDIFVFVANYKNEHGMIEGVIYEFIKGALAFFTTIVSFL